MTENSRSQREISDFERKDRFEGSTPLNVYFIARDLSKLAGRTFFALGGCKFTLAAIVRLFMGERSREVTVRNAIFARGYATFPSLIHRDTGDLHTYQFHSVRIRPYGTRGFHVGVYRKGGRGTGNGE